MRVVLLAALASIMLAGCHMEPAKEADIIRDGRPINAPPQWVEYCQEHGDRDPAC